MKRVLWGGIDKTDVRRVVDEIYAFYSRQLDDLKAENHALRKKVREAPVLRDDAQAAPDADGGDAETIRAPEQDEPETAVQADEAPIIGDDVLQDAYRQAERIFNDSRQGMPSSPGDLLSANKSEMRVVQEQQLFDDLLRMQEIASVVLERYKNAQSDKFRAP